MQANTLCFFEEPKQLARELKLAVGTRAEIKVMRTDDASDIIKLIQLKRRKCLTHLVLFGFIFTIKMMAKKPTKTRNILL